MSDRIVVGIDGSPGSAQALDYAAAEAALSGAGLEVVHAIDLPVDVDFYGVRLATPQIESLQSYADDLLAQAARRVTELQPGLDCSTRHQVGNATTVLIDASRDAAALVVGSRGLGGVGAAFLGSVSSRLAVEAGCPLFVVGENGELPSLGPIVVGVDDSEFSAAALRFALQEAVRRQASVRVVSAYHTPVLAVPTEEQLITQLRESERAEADKVIDGALQEAGADQADGVEIERVAVEDLPAEAILNHAGDAQLIVVGSRGKGLVRRLFLGSVSRQVLQDADRPVAVINLAD